MSCRSRVVLLASSLAAVLLILPAATGAGAEPVALKKGDRIVFLGDSITEQYEYSNLIDRDRLRETSIDR